MALGQRRRSEPGTRADDVHVTDEGPAQGGVQDHQRIGPDDARGGRDPVGVGVRDRVEVVKGPDAPSATSQASAPSAATIRRPLLWRLTSAPVISSVMPNTSEVASTAITNRRRRH
jgi:hypothetical protein